MKKIILLFLCFIFLAVSCASSESANGVALTDDDSSQTIPDSANPDGNGNNPDANPDGSAPDTTNDDPSSQNDDVTPPVDNNPPVDNEPTDTNTVPDEDPLPPTTWTDPATGLTWDARPYVDPKTSEMTVKKAKQYCEDTTLGGFSDWRVPTLNELRTLVRDCKKLICADASCTTITESSCQATEANSTVKAWSDDNCRGMCSESKGCSSAKIEKCQPMSGSGQSGCYWPAEMGGSCGIHWSTTSQTSNLLWVVDFASPTIEVKNNAQPMGVVVHCVRGALCGNKIVEAGEQCDDGNLVAGDGCSPSCKDESALPVCGNSKVEEGETCDDGNTKNGDGCSSTCQKEPAVCGNNKVEEGETCDDGNKIPGDGCSATCKKEPAVCGNSKVEEGEACDDGNTTDEANGCSTTCTNNSECGNGKIESLFETCDDSNIVGGDGCSETCQVEPALILFINQN